MARTPSKMVDLGTTAPPFTLVEPLTQQQLSLEDFSPHKALVVMFICNHCPFVKHVNPQLIQLAHDYTNQEVTFVAINSNDVENFPEDAPEKMKQVAQSYPFPYLFDETQEVAKAYDAVCTPDFFIFNEKNELVYRGQLDDARPGNDKPNDGKDIRKAIDAILHNKPVTEFQKPSIGCNIKWKPN